MDNNETPKAELIEKLKNDPRIFRKAVAAIALAGVVKLDAELDTLCAGFDDGEEEHCDLNGAYNEGFYEGCKLIGKEFEDVMTAFSDDIVQMQAGR